MGFSDLSTNSWSADIELATKDDVNSLNRACWSYTSNELHDVTVHSMLSLPCFVDSFIHVWRL